LPTWNKQGISRKEGEKQEEGGGRREERQALTYNKKRKNI